MIQSTSRAVCCRWPVVHALHLLMKGCIGFCVLCFWNEKVLLQRCTAATLTWDGGGASDGWSVNNNWNPNADPASGDSLRFRGTARLTNTINPGGSGLTLSYNSLNFMGTASGSFLIGGGTYTNGAGGIIVNSASFAQQMTNTTTVLGASQTWNAASNNFFTSAAITLGANVLTITGNSNVTLGGAVGGSGGIIKSGSGTLWLDAANTFTGGISNTLGTIRSTNLTSLGTGPITMSGGSLQISTANQTFSGSISNLVTSTITIDNGITFTNSGIIVGSGGITFNGDGTMVFAGANTFTGAITNLTGTIDVSHASGLGSASSLILNGGTLLFNKGFTNTSANVVLNGGEIQEIDQNVSLGALTLTANSIIDLSSGGSSGSIRFVSGTNIVGVGANLTITGWTATTPLDSGVQKTGAGDLIFFTTTATLSSSFLNNIAFSGYAPGATILSTGELVPVSPEPATWINGLLIFSLFFSRIRNSLRNFFQRTKH